MQAIVFSIAINFPYKFQQSLFTQTVLQIFSNREWKKIRSVENESNVGPAEFFKNAREYQS